MKKKKLLMLAVVPFLLASCTLSKKPVDTGSSTIDTTPTSSDPASIVTSTPITVVPTSDPVTSTPVTDPVTSQPITDPVTSTSITDITTTTTDVEFEYTGYYQAMAGHLDDNDDFRSTLNQIISSNLKSSNYDKAWEILAKADAVDDNNIECLYTGKKIGQNNHGGNNGQWNREHVWAKSHGFGSLESNYAYYDCHHLHATEVSINNARGNLPFDDITSATYSSDSYGNKWDSTAFEPRDEVKGDVARSMFYMVVRYEDSSLDLELEDVRTSISSKNPTLGKLSTLLKWAYEDPVSDFEIRRNNVVYDYQNNRNPFIDHPEFMYYLYPQESEALGVNLDNIRDYIYGDNTIPSNPDIPTPITTDPITSTETPTTTEVIPVINPGETTTISATSPNTRVQMDGTNQATDLGLSSIFSAVGDKNTNTDNNIGLYDTIRLYVGNILTISVDNKYIITTIKITFDQGPENLQVTNSSGSAITAANGVYTINGNSFALKNIASSGQVRMTKIEITYGLK